MGPGDVKVNPWNMMHDGHRLWPAVAEAGRGEFLVRIASAGTCSRRTWLHGNGYWGLDFRWSEQKRYSVTFTATCALSALNAHPSLNLETTSGRGESSMC